MATFTYFGTETRAITKLSKHIHIKIITQNHKQNKNKLKPKKQITDIFSKKWYLSIKIYY
jgi:hypothetical protein